MAALAHVQQQVRVAEEAALARAEREGRVGQVRVQRLRAALAVLGNELPEKKERNALLRTPRAAPPPRGQEPAAAELERARAAYVERVEDATEQWYAELARHRARFLAARRARSAESFEAEMRAAASRSEAQRRVAEERKLAEADELTRERVREALRAQDAATSEAHAASLDGATAAWAEHSAAVLSRQLQLGLGALRMDAAVRALTLDEAGAEGGAPERSAPAPRLACAPSARADGAAQALCADALRSAAQAIAAAAAGALGASLRHGDAPGCAVALRADAAEPALPPRHAPALAASEPAVALAPPPPAEAAARASTHAPRTAEQAGRARPSAPPQQLAAVAEATVGVAEAEAAASEDAEHGELRLMAMLLDRLRALEPAHAPAVLAAHTAALAAAPPSAAPAEFGQAQALAARGEGLGALSDAAAARALRHAATSRADGRGLLPARFLYDVLLLEDPAGYEQLRAHAPPAAVQTLQALVAHALELALATRAPALTVAEALAPLVLPLDHRQTTWARRKAVQYLSALMAAQAFVQGADLRGPAEAADAEGAETLARAAEGEEAERPGSAHGALRISSEISPMRGVGPSSRRQTFATSVEADALSSPGSASPDVVLSAGRGRLSRVVTVGGASPSVPELEPPAAAELSEPLLQARRPAPVRSPPDAQQREEAVEEEDEESSGADVRSPQYDPWPSSAPPHPPPSVQPGALSQHSPTRRTHPPSGTAGVRHTGQQLTSPGASSTGSGPSAMSDAWPSRLAERPGAAASSQAPRAQLERAAAGDAAEAVAAMAAGHTQPLARGAEDGSEDDELSADPWHGGRPRSPGEVPPRRSSAATADAHLPTATQPPPPAPAARAAAAVPQARADDDAELSRSVRPAALSNVPPPLTRPVTADGAELRGRAAQQPVTRAALGQRRWDSDSEDDVDGADDDGVFVAARPSGLAAQSRPQTAGAVPRTAPSTGRAGDDDGDEFDF